MTGGAAIITIKRPSWFLAIGFVLLLGVAAAAALAAAGLPRLGVSLQSPRGGVLSVTLPAGGKPARLVAIAPASDRGQAVSVTTAHDIVNRVEADLAPDVLAVQDRLAAAAATGRVALLIDGAGWVERPVGPSPLNASFFILIAIGLFGGAVGLWVVAAQPHRIAAWGAGASGIGLLLAAVPTGIILNAELIVGGVAARWLMGCNYIGTQLFAGGFVLLFARYPRPLVAARIVIGGVVAAMATMLALVLTEPMPSRLIDRINLIVLADFVALVIFIIMQWRATRRDPVGRRYLRLVGATWALSLGIWTAATVLPQFLDGPPLLDIATGFLLMIPPYAAMAVGLTRGVMFDIDAWAGRLVASAATLAVLLAVETALVLALGVGKGPAASLAFLIAGLVWLAARHRLLDRLLGRRHEGDLRLMTNAHRIVLGTSPVERAANWREALCETYRPLEILPLTPEPMRTVVAEGGLALHVAPPRFGHGLILRSAHEGRALFRRHDADLVDQLRLLCDRIDDDRMAYDRGMQEERGRIAKDLHDDVSGRLLTSLHRDRPDLMRNDVRAALLDIRSIVSGLEGRERALADMLADLRRECGERLAAAGVALDWQADDATADGCILAYPTYRAINAIVREITTNIIRHARADAATMAWSLGPDASTLTLIARDDGVGMAGAPAGSGRRNIAARVEALGGKACFLAEPQGASGTGITVILPLSPRNRGMRPPPATGTISSMSDIG